MDPFMEPIERAGALISRTSATSFGAPYTIRCVISNPGYRSGVVRARMVTQFLSLMQLTVHAVSHCGADPGNHGGDIGGFINIAHRNSSPDVLIARSIEGKKMIFRSIALFFTH